MADAEAFQDRENLISLFACYGKVYAWDVDDVIKMRSQYRIVGSLIGSLPRKPRQNNAFSLPLLLSREETTLLLDKGFARIFYMPGNLPKPSDELVGKFNELRNESVIEQNEQFKKMQEEKRKELADVIADGKKRKREKLASSAAKNLQDQSNENQFNFTCNEINVVERNDEEKEKSKRKSGEVTVDHKDTNLAKKLKREELNNESFEAKETSEKKDLIQSNDCCNKISNENVKESFEGSCSKSITKEANETNLTNANADQGNHGNKLVNETGLQTTNDSDTTAKGLNSVCDMGVLVHIPTVMPQLLPSFQLADWTYPQTSCEKLRYQVFVDLWEKGYYLTSGINFGGDFLAYPGDPIRYHSFFIVIIVPWGKKITPFEIISAGRLGASVKKTALLCSVSDKTGQVIYTSVKWSGIS